MPTARFVTAAEAFISLVDASATLAPVEFVHELEARIIELYAAALTLEPEEPSEEDLPARVSDDEVRDVHGRVSDKLGELNYYGMVFDPFEPGKKPEGGSLADDVADIYRDLREGLDAFRDGRGVDAVWEWRFGFDHHWGRHAVNALTALFALRTSRLG